jgi:hypothetical protein
VAGLQPAFPVIFLAVLCIIVGVAAFIFVSNRRTRKDFSAFAQMRGCTYSAHPSVEAADLSAVVKANIVTITGESSTRRVKFSHLVTGSWKGRDFRFFCCTSVNMSMTTGTMHSHSSGTGFSSVDSREASITCCLQLHLRDSRGIPDLWVKKHTPLDSVYRLTGLQKTELQDPGMNRTFRVFCLDPHAVEPSLLTSRSAEGTAWIEEKLALLSRVSDLIEE